jgi:hypothetical protein
VELGKRDLATHPTGGNEEQEIVCFEEKKCSGTQQMLKLKSGLMRNEPALGRLMGGDT